jgi:hypothetical protein
MRKIIVHNPCNSLTKTYRNYNLFWDDLTNFLKKKYEVIENREYELANEKEFNINLEKQISCSSCLSMYECEYIIEFVDNGDFYILSASDYPSYPISQIIYKEQNNPHLKKVLVSQFDRDGMTPFIDLKNQHKYIPWIYFPTIDYNLEEIYSKRKNLSSYVDKLYFRGSDIKNRPILQNFESEYFQGYDPIGGPDVYFDELIQYKVGLSVGGRAEFCYRDIEYMAIGVPFLRFEYRSEMNPKLIPNFHYISVEKPSDLKYDRLGDQSHVNLLLKRFIEVKDDQTFLNFISNNARNFYQEYLSKEKRIKHTLNILGI